MGIEDFLLASAILGIVAQRLVRRICPECRTPVPSGYQMEEWRSIRDGMDWGQQPEQLFTGRGCPACSQTGYQGRTGIYELLVMDDTIRPLILQRADASTLRRQAIGQGMKTMAVDGWSKVAQGVTTVEEVLRVTQE
jgi:general secretion pathway protein E